MTEYYSHRDFDGYDDDEKTTYDTDDTAADAVGVDRLDVMSFLSVLAQPGSAVGNWTGLVFLSVYLGPWNMFLPITPYSGSSFSVTLVQRKYILRQTLFRLNPWEAIPDLVALKTPKLDGQSMSPKNSRLFRSIAKEYQILQSEVLRSHENIVSVYGCCWQSLDIYSSRPIPSLILEGTKLGNLMDFSHTRLLTLRERLRLCMHISSGLHAIHAVGVIHGDLKPENILVFHSTERGYIAKIADFGSAVLLSETALPSRKPVGTVLYSAPECYADAVRFGRDELFKIDIFTLGITLASLLQGMHVVEELKKLSRSSLESLKKSDKLWHWFAAFGCEDSEHAAFQWSTGDEEEDDWVTDLTWYDNSLLADEHLWLAYLQMARRSLSASAEQRYGSAEDVLSILRSMLRLHLRNILGHPKIVSGPNSGIPTPDWWAHMGRVMGMSRARLRKITGVRVGSPSKLNKEEIEAVSLWCQRTRSFLGEAQFIYKHTLTRRYKTNRQPRNFRRGRLTSIPKLVLRLAVHMMDIADSRIQPRLETSGELKIIGLERNKVFKVSRNSNIFWMLPYAVRELLKSRLMEEAANVSASEAHRADAAYEYAAMVLNSGELPTPNLGKALELLAMSARYGHVEAQYSVGKLCNDFGYPLLVSSEEEIEWLLAALKAGSSTARKRFQELEPERFTQVSREARHRYGLNCPKTNETLFEELQRAKKSGDPSETLYAFFYEVAITGNVQLLLMLPKCRPDVYDCRNVLGETPLLVACRGGHVTVVKMLLALGADPSIAMKDDVTPLHFLGAFDDKYIPDMASLLLQHGAELNKVCRRAPIYKEIADSPFGGTGGPPLLWAVTARSRCAIQTLVDKGADPFMREFSSGPYDKMTQYSAIAFAATFHQHDLVDIMLSPAKNSKQSVIHPRLLTSVRDANGKTPGALLSAVDCNPGLRFREYLIHGNHLEEAALKCVQLLIQYGADPVALTPARRGQQGDDHPITVACISGNLSTVTYLWDYKNGALRPSPETWMKTLSFVIFHRLRNVLDFLIERRSDIAPSVDIDTEAIMQSFTLTNDRHILLGVMKLVLRPRSAYLPSHYRDIFWTAVRAGHFEVARLVFDKGCLDAAFRTGGETILGSLIGLSPHFLNMEQKVRFILSLPADKDELFWNVAYRYGSGLTALQAVICSPTPDVCMDAGVFRVILEHFHESRHLNAKIGGHTSQESAGYSALHLAAQYGNFAAADFLLDMPGIEPNLQDASGRTPTDICISLEQELASHRVLGGLKPDAPSASRKREANMAILQRLMAAGGRIEWFSTVFMRSSKDNFDILDRVQGNVQSVRLLGMLEGNLEVSESSRSLVATAPTRSLLAFSDKPSPSNAKLPVDLEACIHPLWSGF